MSLENKKRIYIALFVLLGILLGLLVHGAVELWYIKGLITNFPKYSLGYSWAEWFIIHQYLSVIVFIASVVLGYFQGKFWWRLVYVEKRFDPFFRKLQRFLYDTK